MPYTPQRQLRAERLSRDEKYGLLGILERYLLRRLLEYVDQRGRETASASKLRDEFFEFDTEIVSELVQDTLLLLESQGWLLLYEPQGSRRKYVQINPTVMREFHSRLDPRDPSQFPAPTEAEIAAMDDLWATSGPPLAEGRGKGGGWSPVQPPADLDAWRDDPSIPPPPGCRRHRNVNTPLGNCGACGGALRIHNQFMNGEITHEQAVAMHGARPGAPMFDVDED